MKLQRLMRKKPVGYTYDSQLQRTLNATDLILMGIGAIIGAGVFVLTGIVAATKSGPAVVISYVIAGLASMFAALAYAELAASIGGSGSAYNYAFTGFGEFAAWLIGWDLLLEYLMSVSAVAIGWSAYVNNLLQSLHIYLPYRLLNSPAEGGDINLLAVIIILGLMFLLCFGVKLSARFNACVVFIKLITIFVFICVALRNVNPANWQPFLPFGWGGVMQGAALVFFSYIGFDALATAVEETVDPQRNVPIGIIGSLIVCTIIYIVVAGLLTGIVPYTTLNVESPVADALLNLGYRFIAGFIAVGAIAGLTTVMLVMYFGLTRICLAIARDGLLPIWIAKINYRTATPIRVILITGVLMAAIAGFVPLGKAAELVNIGTLAAFVFVCAGALIMRVTHPQLHRPFNLPYSSVIHAMGIFFCLYLMINLPWMTWLRFIIWAVVGILIYFFYSHQRSIFHVED